MNVRVLPLLSLIFVFASQVSGLGLGKKACSCGLSSGGVDVCGCDDVVVRPPPPQKLFLSNLLSGKLKQSSIEEQYSFEDSYIKPATGIKCDSVEIPCHFYHKGGHYPKHSEFHDIYDNNESEYNEDEGHYYSDKKISAVPADAVSLTLAYELAKRAGTAIKEGDLNFGPRTKPKDGTYIKTGKHIPEDRLFSFDKQVVELKYPSFKRTVSHKEETEEEYEAEKNYEKSHKYLTYADLGYVPEISKCKHRFIKSDTGYEDDAPYEKEEYWTHRPKLCARKGKVGGKYHEAHNDYYSSEEHSDYSTEDKDDSYSHHTIGKRIKSHKNLISKLSPSKGYDKY